MYYQISTSDNLKCTLTAMFIATPQYIYIILTVHTIAAAKHYTLPLLFTPTILKKTKDDRMIIGRYKALLTLYYPTGTEEVGKNFGLYHLHSFGKAAFIYLIPPCLQVHCMQL